MSRRRAKRGRRTGSFITRTLAKRYRKSKLKLNTPLFLLSCSSELKRVLKAKAKAAEAEEKKKAKGPEPPAKAAGGKAKAKVEEEVDPSKYTDNRKKFI